LLFFTNMGRVYRAKGYDLPEGGRDSKGQHVANLLEFQPGEQIAQVLALKTYTDKPYLVLATKRGLVKKSRLVDYDSNRSRGLIAINLRDVEGEDGEHRPDELVAARLVSDDDDLMLVSRKGQSLRFNAHDGELRPTGRATSGVKGMSFRDEDELLAMDVIAAGVPEAGDDSVVEGPEDDDAVVTDSEGPYSFVVTEHGFAKRTAASAWTAKHRGGLGVKVAKLTEERGDLVGAMLVDEGDEVLVIMQSGKVLRSSVNQVDARGKNTMGVTFAKPAKGDRIIGIARNVERKLAGDDDTEVEGGDQAPVTTASADVATDTANTDTPSNDTPNAEAVPPTVD
jgi:DNA gyrase subunit A